MKNRLLFYKFKIKSRWNRYLLERGKFDNNDRIAKLQFEDEWERRTKNVIRSCYNSYIPRLTDAGNISGGFQKMHNGLEVSTGDYYGLPIAKMLYLNKGVHEPEEEKIFLEILSILPNEPLMVEMGSYWAFYSMWFLKDTHNGKVYLIEPDKKNLEIGKKNFKKNQLYGTFDNYFIGKNNNDNGIIPIISLDAYLQAKGLKHINIAHSDIQGYELEMLRGAEETLNSGIIDYFFISTHTNELHYQCIDFLKEKKYEILYQTDLDNVSSFDGLIVAISPKIQ